METATIKNSNLNKKIDKNFNAILKYFIIIQPFLDVINAFFINVCNLNFTIGIFIRGIFLIFIFLIVTIVYKKKYVTYYYFAMIFYSILFIIGNIIYKYPNNNILEIKELVKTFYFPLILISLYSIKDKININPRYLLYTLFIYLFFLFIPIILNIGFESYEITKTGTVGIFYSANEISAILSILFPFTFLLVKQQKKICFLITIICYVMVILNIGTKTPIIALIITFIIIFTIFIIRNIKQKKYKNIYYCTAIVLVLVTTIIIFLPKTAFYKNIKVHLEFLGIENITDVFKNKKLIDHFIFSERLTFLDNKKILYEQKNGYQKLFGIGYYNEETKMKLIEMDYFDIYYNHGIIGYILYFLIYIYVLIRFIKNINLKDDTIFIKLIGMILILLLSLFTGHIITAPAVSFISICVILSKNKKKSHE